jgi:hypothetical protein
MRYGCACEVCTYVVNLVVPTRVWLSRLMTIEVVVLVIRFTRRRWNDENRQSPSKGAGQLGIRGSSHRVD